MLDQKISKYLKGTATSKEEREVHDWITASEKNAAKFNHLKAKYIASTLDVTKVDLDNSYNDILKTNNSSTKYNGRVISVIMKSAAIMALLVGVGFIFKSAVIDSDAAPIIPEDAIILQMENGKIEVISEGGATTVVDTEGNVLGAQKGSQIVYKNNGSLKGELAYNTLTVPYGKRFDLLLSDGTQITLNSVNTTLLEGSVSVYNSQDTFESSNASLLQPGYKAEWNKYNKEILVEEADIAMHTDWLNGKIILRHVPFKNIVKKLERHYNVEITNNNANLDDELFTASFDVESIEQVMETFNKTYPINYNIDNNEITIN